jgi:hypothetical protein
MLFGIGVGEKQPNSIVDSRVIKMIPAEGIRYS